VIESIVSIILKAEREAADIIMEAEARATEIIIKATMETSAISSEAAHKLSLAVKKNLEEAEAEAEPECEKILAEAREATSYFNTEETSRDIIHKFFESL